MHQWIVTGLAASLLLSGCGKAEKESRSSAQELRLNLMTEPPTLDPRKAIDAVSISVITLCFEGLMRNDSDDQPVPAIAETYTISEDQKRYTFLLRKTYWSDGTPLTAADFENTWKTILDPSFPSENAPELYIIKNAKAAHLRQCTLDEVGIKALDDKTLQIDLEHPAPYFLAALATHLFLPTPSHITSAYPHWTKNHYIGNGPFLMKQWKHQNQILLEKNPKYWEQEHTHLKKVAFTMVQDETTALGMYENGELDWTGSPLCSIPTEALPSLEKTGDLQHYEIAGTYFYMFNTTQFPFTNRNIRRAFALAINREAIIANITQTHQTPATGFIPPLLWGKAFSYFQDADVAEAKRLLEIGLSELGITKRDLPTITLSYNTNAGHHKIAQAIQQQWNQALGIEVALENKEWKVFLDELRQRKFQIARMGGIANINDPVSMLKNYQYPSTSSNYCGWENPLFSALLEKADQTIEKEQRIALLQEAEQILMNEMPIAPLYYYNGVYLKKPYVKGIHPSAFYRLDLKQAFLND